MDLLARIDAAIPAKVKEVCATLAASGHQAVLVGGVVRDVLLGRNPGDWDVATSARPEQVMELFRHTIPTGLEHGTVTIVTGKGKHTHVEVTTFRGEGAYSDARRPDHVVFGVPLHEDLARRDLVVNAIAYDPLKRELIDPFGGQDDIAKRRLRAVGSAVERFTEDGLRVMRAVRFAAQLEFDLDPETEAGIAPALPSLEKQARERVCVELRKMLDAREPSRGLRIAERTGIMKSILPELAPPDVDAWLARIDRAAAPVRLSAMLVPLVVPDAPVRHLCRATMKRVLVTLRELKFSNLESELAAQLVAVSQASGEREWTATEVRQLLSELDRDKRVHAVELWQSEATPNAALVDNARTALAEGHPLSIGDLAIRGQDVMKALTLEPGPVIGRILEMLKVWVLEEPSRNTREALLKRAQELELELGR